MPCECVGIECASRLARRVVHGTQAHQWRTCSAGMDWRACSGGMVSHDLDAADDSRMPRVLQSRRPPADWPTDLYGTRASRTFRASKRVENECCSE